MTAATITAYIEGMSPGKEVIQLECSDGETYVSRKFDIIRGARAILNTDSDNHINVPFSGKTATINANGQTDAVVTLILYGVTGP